MEELSNEHVLGHIALYLGCIFAIISLGVLTSEGSIEIGLERFSWSSFGIFSVVCFWGFFRLFRGKLR